MVFFPNTPKTKQRLIRPPFSVGFQPDARQLLTPGLHDLLHRFGLPGASTGSSCLDRCCILFHVLNISIYLYIYIFYYKQTISEISDDDLREVIGIHLVGNWCLMIGVTIQCGIWNPIPHLCGGAAGFRQISHIWCQRVHTSHTYSE
jgi:hypothetical protein